MKISEVVEKLGQIKKDHGDLDTFIAGPLHSPAPVMVIDRDWFFTFDGELIKNGVYLAFRKEDVMEGHGKGEK